MFDEVLHPHYHRPKAADAKSLPFTINEPIQLSLVSKYHEDVLHSASVRVFDIIVRPSSVSVLYHTHTRTHTHTHTLSLSLSLLSLWFSQAKRNHDCSPLYFFPGNRPTCSSTARPTSAKPTCASRIECLNHALFSRNMVSTTRWKCGRTRC